MFQDIKIIFKSFFRFLIFPLDNKYDNNKATAISYIAVFLMLFFIAFVVRVFAPHFLVSLFGIELIEFAEPSGYNSSLLYIILVGMFAAPFFEELLYRYPLKYTRTSLIVAIIAYYICSSFLLRAGTDFSITRTIVSSVLILILASIRNNRKIQEVIEKYWNKSLIIIIYLGALYFAMCHFGHPIVGTNWILVLFMTFTQFFSALYFSFIRLKKGFLWCWLFHAGFNSFITIPVVIELFLK